MNIEYNMLSRFELTEKELQLLMFVINNIEVLGESFSIHDVSCNDCVISNTYYNKLYDKGLFTKPARGQYSLNIELLTQLANKQEEYNKALKRKKEVKHKILAWICRVCFIPMIFLGILLSMVVPTFGLISIGIGILELVYSRSYFKRNKDKNRAIKE